MRKKGENNVNLAGKSAIPPIKVASHWIRLCQGLVQIVPACPRNYPARSSSPCLNRRFLAWSFPSKTSTAMRYPARHASRQRARSHGDRVDSRDEETNNEK